MEQDRTSALQNHAKLGVQQSFLGSEVHGASLVELLQPTVKVT